METQQPPARHKPGKSRPPGSALEPTVADVRRLVVLVTVFLVTVTAASLLAGSGDAQGTHLAIFAFMAAAVALAYHCAQFHPLRTIQALIAAMWLVAAANMWLFSGVYVSGMVFFPLVIAVAGWIPTGRWVRFFTVLTSVWIALVAAAQHWGWHGAAPLTPPVHAAVNWIASLAVIGVFIQDARRMLSDSRDKALNLAAQVHQQLQTARLQRDELRLFMQSIPAAVVAYDHEWRVRRCNGRYAAFFGRTPEELEGKQFEEFAPPEVVAQTTGLKEALAVGKTHVTRMYFTRDTDGDVQWFEVRSVPQMRHDKLYQSVVAISNITPVVQAEQALKAHNDKLSQRVTVQAQALDATRNELQTTQESLLHAEAKAAISTLVASASHELNTPIGNSVLVASSMADAIRELRADVANGQLTRSGLQSATDTLHEGIGMLGRNLERVKTLMQQFKQVSADQASEKRRTFDLATVVQDTVAALQPSLRRQSHTVELDLHGGIALDSYPGAIGQIVINLINNAYMHAFAEGSSGRVDVTVRPSPKGAELCVRDNGVGMDETVRKRLFEPFFSTRFGDGGTGLGMSIVQHLALKVLGGTIQVESAPGKGSSFVVTLPLRAPDTE